MCDVFISSVSMYAVNQFKEEEYISCVSQEPVMSTSYYAYSIFDHTLLFSYSPSTLEQRCVYVSSYFTFYPTNAMLVCFLLDISSVVTLFLMRGLIPRRRCGRGLKVCN